MNEEECCGCAACSVVCPKSCISMEEGTLGHKFPIVNLDKCIGCKACEKVCPMRRDIRVCDKNLQKAYAAYSKDETIRYNGSSGGMFGVFAKHLMEQGYIVYGAAFDKNLKLNCQCAENLEGLYPLTKSKYLQSNLEHKYLEIRNKLIANKYILFVSTPCQVLALKNILGKEYSNLITVDFFCHGVPSQAFFDKAIEYDGRKLGGKISAFQFRKKVKNGVTPHYYEVKLEGRKNSIIDLYYKSSFYAFFQKYINLRESCYNCKFATRNRISDITIGDFHDIETYIKGVNRFKGVSMVIVNTVVGNALWESCKCDLKAFDIGIEKLISDKVIFSGGTEKPKLREIFLLDYINMPYAQLVDKYVNPRSYWKNNIYYSMPWIIRKLIKKFWG